MNGRNEVRSEIRKLPTYLLPMWFFGFNFFPFLTIKEGVPPPLRASAYQITIKIDLMQGGTPPFPSLYAWGGCASTLA